MLGGIYKKILDKLPAGVFVFDSKLKIVYTNAAFRRSFPADAKKKGALKDVLVCGESACGTGGNCARCSFKKVMTAAVQTGEEKSATAEVKIARGGREDVLSVRIRVFPMEGKNGLFLGLTDGSYRSEAVQDMLTAQKMQQRLLPVGKKMGGVPYSYMYIPCLEIGGDLPDVYELNGQIYGILSDVSGKGVSAGMLSAFVKAGFDRKQESLAEALRLLSTKFAELNQDERAYITLAGVRIDTKESKIRYVSAGHNAPILLKNALGINEIESPAPPVSNWIPDFNYEEREFPFEKGDLLVLITDGVTECANSAGELFGIERAESVLLQSHGAEDFIAKLKSALTVFSGGKFSDDVTAIAFDL
ncbi:MAG: SpoIIE family protein phosphatase [Clostridia bacterium]|nr:SpoIIE family protein phosphatase [Clostridia bacterium]